MTGRVFIDTTVLAYALGRAHPQRTASRDLLQRASRGDIEVHASVEAIQELLFHRLRRTTRDQAVAQAMSAHDLCRVHSFDEAVTARMFELVQTTSLRGRDAVHAATALTHGFTEIVTADRDFDTVPGLARIAPADAA